MTIRILLICAAGIALAACAETTASSGGGDTSASAAASGEIAAPAGLTRDELVIWNSLTDEAKAQAVEFIANGGTFAQFIAV